MKKELLKGLTEEQIAKAKKCKTNEELIALAKEEGFTLDDEQLAAVSGGVCSESTVAVTCPKCGTHFNGEVYRDSSSKNLGKFTCPNCGHTWKELV